MIPPKQPNMKYPNNGKESVVHTTISRRWSGLLDVFLLRPVDQALLALVFTVGSIELRGGRESSLVVKTVEDTGTKSRVSENLSRSCQRMRYCRGGHHWGI